MAQSDIKEVVIKSNAIQEVPGILRKYTDKKKIYLIVDQNTYKVVGRDLEQILIKANFTVNKVLLEGKVIANTDYFFKLLKDVGRDGYLLACGSGTINDLTRYISYKLEIPYIVFATAPSMDGYASHVSPITVDGVKATYNAVTAEAIVADLDILKNAPWEMIQAGYGDLLGKISALMDWKLSNIIFAEEVNDQAVNMVEMELLKLIELTTELPDRTEESIHTLIKGLVNAGIAMQIVGNSRPASGAEHHISHFLEMYGEMYEQKLPPHGVKVALGEYFAAELYKRLYNLDFNEIRNIDDIEKRKIRIKDNYLGRAEPVLKTLEERWEDHQLDLNILKEKEVEIKSLIEDNMKYLQGIKTYLKEVGILDREDVKAISKEWLLKALESAFEIRNRYTVAALLDQLGYLEKWSNEIVDNYLEDLNS